MSQAVFKALATFQEKVPKIDLDGTVKTKAYEFKYATLGNIIDKIKAPLKEAGLVYTQTIDGDKIVTTLAAVEDGSTIQSTMPIVFGADPKQVGASITYYRRYALVAMLGIAGEEDKDAPEAAQKKKMSQQMLDKALERIAEGEPGVAKAAYEHLDCSFEQLKTLIEAGG